MKHRQHVSERRTEKKPRQGSFVGEDTSRRSEGELERALLVFLTPGTESFSASEIVSSSTEAGCRSEKFNEARARLGDTSAAFLDSETGHRLDRTPTPTWPVEAVEQGDFPRPPSTLQQTAKGLPDEEIATFHRAPTLRVQRPKASVALAAVCRQRKVAAQRPADSPLSLSASAGLHQQDGLEVVRQPPPVEELPVVPLFAVLKPRRRKEPVALFAILKPGPRRRTRVARPSSEPRLLEVPVVSFIAPVFEEKVTFSLVSIPRDAGGVPLAGICRLERFYSDASTRRQQKTEQPPETEAESTNIEGWPFGELKR